MDSAQYEYLRLIKYQLVVMGIWPYQTVLHRSSTSLIFIPIIGAQLILQMKRLLDIMQEDWSVYKKKRDEYDLLREEYAIGKRLITGYTVSLLGFVMPFATVPLVLNAADALGLCNISDDRPLAFRIEHFVDVDKYYNVLLIHSFFGTIGYTLIASAINCMMLAYVTHESGLCEILRVRLKNFVEIDTMDIDLHPSKRDDKWYENARDCVLLHKHIIESVSSVASGFDILCVSFTQFQVGSRTTFRTSSLYCDVFTDISFVLGGQDGDQFRESSVGTQIHFALGLHAVRAFDKRQMVSIVDKLQETFGDNASEKSKTAEINSLQILHFKFAELQC
ncbi:unnamed protein product, partial [Heterotrigona itama]